MSYLICHYNLYKVDSWAKKFLWYIHLVKTSKFTRNVKRRVLRTICENDFLTSHHSLSYWLSFYTQNELILREVEALWSLTLEKIPNKILICINFIISMIFVVKIINSRQIFRIRTSWALLPYYSKALKGLCSELYESLSPNLHFETCLDSSTTDRLVLSYIS